MTAAGGACVQIRQRTRERFQSLSKERGVTMFNLVELLLVKGLSVETEA